MEGKKQDYIDGGKNCEAGRKKFKAGKIDKRGKKKKKKAKKSKRKGKKIKENLFKQNQNTIFLHNVNPALKKKGRGQNKWTKKMDFSTNRCVLLTSFFQLKSWIDGRTNRPTFL